MQDDFRVSSQADAEPRPALGRLRALDRGGRPAVELRRVDRPVRGRLRQRGHRRASRSAATCRPTRRATSARGFGFAYDVDGRRHDDRPRRLRRLLELHAGRHVVVEGAEPAVPAVDGARRPTHVRDQPAALGRPAAAPGGRPDPAGGRAARGRSSTSTSATRYAHQLERQRPAAARHELHGRARLRRARGAARCCSRATRTRRRRSWA